MHDEYRSSYGLGIVWAFVGLAVIALLSFSAWRVNTVMFGDHAVEPIYDACIETYGDNNCRCFSGIMSVQLSSDGYDSYVRGLEREALRRRYFDGELAEETLRNRDLRVCVDASDICSVPICEPPRYSDFSLGYDPSYTTGQSPDAGDRTWEEGL